MTDLILPAGVVAVLALPIPAGRLTGLTRALESMYGEGLVIRTDLSVKDCMVIAHPRATP